LCRVLITLASVVLMWVTLYFIVRIRSEVADLVGDEYAENEWGFGQILALMAWLPTIVDVMCIWICKCAPAIYIPVLGNPACLHLEQGTMRKV
jgi:hypothetical protein